MGQYIYTIAVGALFVAVIMGLTPGGSGERIGRYVAFIGALALTLTMLSPVISFVLSEGEDLFGADISDGKDREKNTKAYGEYYASTAAMTLYELYGTDIEKIDAAVTFTDDGEIKEIALSVTEGLYYSEKEAGMALSDILGINTTVKEGKDGG